MADETVFIENLHYVPDADWTLSAFSVLRAGKVATAPNYCIRRASHVGQDLLFCLSGTGTVELPAQYIDIQPGQLVWIPNEVPHAHVANARSPWLLLWFRFDGPNPAATRIKLFGDGVPRVTIAEPAVLVSWFERLFSALRRRDSSLDFRLNQLVGDFFLIVDQALAGPVPGGAAGPLARVVTAVRTEIRRPWNMDDLARLTGLSPSQTRRLFHKYLRESPRRWLIRERLIAAQSMMVRENTPLSDVAEACGFCDVYHFGREFKRIVGSTPAAWRRKEVGSTVMG
ncbi:AraC family transcriptional regulator [Lichenifustis flavocetrariae]|uniref:AraC family transcriptional regulator n=1 Tax=Lichenifustis flavocetrariae TaxID=2949735 RepID=A0AA41YYI9_9HYPH|nr:AraC family transcriptional regulator [Lichenifustis flavocetrariae]MCW6510934.1 AraC family transcriptional regulator [Lichenifustis flavocetrariae]